MDSIHFTLPGDPRTKKNHQDIKTGYGGNKYIRQNEGYLAYEDACLWQLKAIRQKLEKEMPPPPYIAKYTYYMASLRKVDGLNLQAATDDILVKANIFEDDNVRIIVGHDGSRVYYDKDNPRVEITITHTDEETFPTPEKKASKKP